MKKSIYLPCNVVPVNYNALVPVFWKVFNSIFDECF